MRKLITLSLVLPLIWSGPTLSTPGQLKQPLSCQERAERLESRPAFMYVPHQDRTLVILSLRRLTCENLPGLSVEYYFDGAEMNAAPRHVSLIARVLCPAGEGLSSCSQASVLLDDEEVVALGELQPGLLSFIDYPDGSSLSSRYAMIPTGTFVRIGKARKVEVSIGRNSFVLPERHLKALREVALKLEGAI